MLLHMNQVWKHQAAPLLWDHLATQVDSVDAYTLLYHEAALTTLLEVRPDCPMQQPNCRLSEGGNQGVVKLTCEAGCMRLAR